MYNELKKKKKLLMLGTSKGSVQLVKAAKEQGYYTIVTDPQDPEVSISKKISDEYWMIDTTDINELEQRCRDNNIEGIIAGISTYNIPKMIELSKKLNLPCYANLKSWHYTVDKYDFKKLCKECNVPIAKDFYVSDIPTKEEIEKIEYPVVVKAVDLSANRGMSYCYSKQDILPALNKVKKESENPKYIIEKMLKGYECTAYYALNKGEATLVALYENIHGKNMPTKCYAINITSCDKLDIFKREMDESLKKFMKKAEINEGVCWFEMIFNEDGHFYTLEMGYRMNGEMIAIPIKEVYGFDSYKYLVECAMGIEHSENPNEMQVKKKVGTSYVLWSKDKNCNIKSIEGNIEKLCAKYNMYVEPYCKIGDKIIDNVYLLVFTFSCDDINQTIEIIKNINNEVSIKDQNNEDIILRFTDFEIIEELYNKSIKKIGVK